MRRFPAALALWACVLTLSACDEGAFDASDQGCPTLSSFCDILSERCQQRVFAATACTRGQSDATMPGIRVISRAELTRETRTSSAEWSDKDRLWGRSLALLELIPPDQSYEQSYVQDRTAFVAGYYSRETQAVTLIEEELPDDDVAAMLLLSHEFVHALQDQREGLEHLHDTYDVSSDSNDALRCLIEGEAEFISVTTVAAIEGVKPRKLAWDVHFNALLDYRLDELAMAEAPLFYAYRLVYPVGENGVAHAYLRDGLAGIEALYADLPSTFLSWASPERPRADEALTVACEPPEPPEGYVLSRVEEQGMLGLLALQVARGNPSGYEPSQQWAADSYAIYTSEATDDVFVSWRIRLRSESAAEALAKVLERGRREEQVRREGDEVLLSVASAPGLFSRWSPPPCVQSD